MNCKDIKVSIIIPVYNAEKYLRECLDSAVSQTIGEKEIICIDDGSSDGSYQILRKYQERCPCVRILSQDNRGAGEARNAGLKAASGEYVSFLDADDFYLEENALEKMVCACETNHLPACAGLRRVYEDGGLTDFYLYRDYFENGKNPDGIMLKYDEYQDDYFYQNYIFSMKGIKKNEIWFPSYRRYQDAPFFLRFMVSAGEYMVLPVEFYGYRFSQAALGRKQTYVKDVLKGIRDNARLAHEKHLDILKMVLVHRIVEEYAEGILSCADDETLGLLREIEGILFDRPPAGEDERISKRSLELIRLIAADYVRGGLARYFERKGITACAVYGLGNFGKMTVALLKKSDRLAIYGVDKKVTEADGITVVSLEEANEKCSHMIVTPVRGNGELVRDIKAVWNGTVWGLYKLLCEAEKQA